jgi:hypothetical protein
MLQLFATIVSTALALGACALLVQSLLDYREDIRWALAGRASPAPNVARVRLVGRPRRIRSIRMRPVASPVPLRAAA